MRHERRLCFERWVPHQARQKLSELYVQNHLTTDDRAILERLAGHPAMNTSVWKKLPHKPPDMQGRIIGWAFSCATVAAAQRPPFPRKKSDLFEYLQKYPPVLTAENAATRALILHEAMVATKIDSLASWRSFWPGDAEVTFDLALQFIKNIEEFYRRLHADRQALIAMANLPKIRKRRARNASQMYFSELMSDRLTYLYGRPNDAVVAALTEVVFDLEAGVGETTIRGRRRSHRVAEHSGKKST
jgi:hypothetical protein